MTEQAIGLLLPESAQQTLETMFFVAPDTVSTITERDAGRPAGALIAATLSFQGLPHGHFGLLVQEALARTLAANFIGCDESGDLSSGQVTGVIGELANMICGAVLSRLESDASFDLGAPQSIEVGGDDPGPDFASGTPSICRLEFPEGALVAFLAFEDSV
jgi:CheY-specific phosphatase CheX